MHDTTFEQKLRAALQAEGDALPLTITAAELERRLALRRRAGPNRFASIGLAAAISVALLGLAGVVGGWFEQRPVVPAPLPSASPAASTAPSNAPTIGPSILPSGVFPDRLPSLDDLLAPLDPVRIVRAQAVGPAEGQSGTRPSREEIGPMGVGFAPITTAGSYRLSAACIGTAGLNVTVTSDQAAEAREFIPITCNGAVSARDVGLEVGDRLALRSTSWLSWRVVLESPERDPLPSLDIAPPIDPPAGEAVLVGNSDSPGAPPPEVPGPLPIGDVPGRDHYTVQVACAGASTLRYTFGNKILDTGTAADGTIDVFSETAVECDGLSHADSIDIVTPSGAQLYVTVDDGARWFVTVSAEEPPISLEPDGGGWQLVGGSGPDLDYNLQQYALSYLTSTKANTEIRVVVTCLGGGFVDIVVQDATVEDPPTLGSFRAECQADGPTSTAQVIKLRSQAFVVLSNPSGKMWKAITLQERVAPTPAP